MSVIRRGVGRDHWLRRIEQLDPDVDHAEIYRITVAHEFPWDMNQSLSMALFRTYAVPSIGGLLHRTGEFTTRPQKRYDDTVLLLDAVLEHGVASGAGRTAVRRMNRMHGAYDIPDDDLRYVLATFVVVPARWMERFGWRPLSEHERVASVHYYRELGRHMGIRDVPTTFDGFATYLDDYEQEHFALDPGGRAVADATLDLMATFPPNDRLPAGLVRRFAYGLMDDPLLDAFGYPRPSRLTRWLAESALRARAVLVRRMRPRLVPKYGRDQSSVRGYPDGYDLAALGTFPGRVDVPGHAPPRQR
jgi:hypothetical protein